MCIEGPWTKAHVRLSARFIETSLRLDYLIAQDEKKTIQPEKDDHSNDVVAVTLLTAHDSQ